MRQALYRKYRPKSFAEVVGQAHITEIIKNQISDKKTAHAYLFTGSRGTGKTTCAKIISKAINCLNPSEGEPCGTCDICMGIDNGSALDIVEIDAASNNSVDDVRELREEAVYTPAMAEFRVYIIDEVHMLSTSAFNALLKIMEEPPEHVVFILATTEVHKIPATVISRCQRFDFKRIDMAEIADRLLEVAQKEDINLTRDGALYIAKLSDGGMRDALSLLDVASAKHEIIDADAVAKTAGLLDAKYITEIVEHIINRDVAMAIKSLETAHENAVEYQRLTVQLIEYMRDMMITYSLPQPEEFLISATSAEEIRRQSSAYGMENILNAISVFSKTLDGMSKTTQSAILLEAAVIRLCTDTKAQSANQAVKSANTEDSKLNEKIKELENTVKSLLEGNTVTKKAKAQPVDTAVPVTERERRLAKPFPKWQEILEILKTSNGALYGALTNSSAYTCDEILLIDCKSDLFLNLIRDNEYARTSLRKAAQDVSGVRYKLGPYKENEYRVSEESDPIDDIVNTLSATDVELELK